MPYPSPKSSPLDPLDIFWGFALAINKVGGGQSFWFLENFVRGFILVFFQEYPIPG